MEEGLFKSAFLLKASHFVIFRFYILTLFQAYKYIFTSPTSANEVSMEAVETDNDDMPSAPKRSKKNLRATRSHVASLIGLRKVTPRSIAYVAVQVSFLQRTFGVPIH
jgi:hypothetical protein